MKIKSHPRRSQTAALKFSSEKSPKLAASILHKDHIFKLPKL